MITEMIAEIARVGGGGHYTSFNAIQGHLSLRILAPIERARATSY